MNTKKIIFEIADVKFCYNYSVNIIVNESLTINSFMIDEDTSYDIYNSIFIMEDINFTEWEKEKMIFQTPAWTKYANHYIFHPNGKKIAVVSEKKNCTEVITYIEKLDTSVHPLPICVTGFLLQQFLINNRKGFIMHGAVLKLNNDGCVFTGNSGVGKSTISSLIKSNLFVEQISDDRFIIKENEGKLYAYGNPFDSKIERNLNKGIEITTFFFLHHGIENKFIEIEKQEIIKKLLTVSLLPYGNVNDMNWAMSYLRYLSLHVRFYDYYFQPNRSAVFELINLIEKNSMKESGG